MSRAVAHMKFGVWRLDSVFACSEVKPACSSRLMRFSCIVCISSRNALWPCRIATRSWPRGPFVDIVQKRANRRVREPRGIGDQIELPFRPHAAHGQRNQPAGVEIENSAIAIGYNEMPAAASSQGQLVES